MKPDELKQKMQERQPCGHTNEEHLAAAVIVAACEALHMPFEIMRTACAMISDGSHDKSEATPLVMAPLGHA